MTEQEFHLLFDGARFSSRQHSERTRIAELPGDDGDTVLVHCTISSKGTFVSVFATAVHGMDSPSGSLLKRCLELNEETWQGKFSLAKSAEEGKLDIDFQFEVPARLLNGEQLERAVFGCAAIVGKYRQELKGLRYG